MAGFKIACGMAVAFIAFVVCSLLIHVCVCVCFEVRQCARKSHHSFEVFVILSLYKLAKVS